MSIVGCDSFERGEFRCFLARHFCSLSPMFGICPEIEEGVAAAAIVWLWVCWIVRIRRASRCPSEAAIVLKAEHCSQLHPTPTFQACDAKSEVFKSACLKLKLFKVSLTLDVSIDQSSAFGIKTGEIRGGTCILVGRMVHVGGHRSSYGEGHIATVVGWRPSHGACWYFWTPKDELQELFVAASLAALLPDPRMFKHAWQPGFFVWSVWISYGFPWVLKALVQNKPV